MTEKLNQTEIEHRVAVLKRFKALLQEQRKKFNDYLIVLETQERSIGEENIDAVLHHTELEQSLISDIFTIQKVIDPIEQMYKMTLPEKSDTEILSLKNDLGKLQSQVLSQNEKNRKLLQSRMDGLKEELTSMKNLHTRLPAQTFKKEEYAPSVIDISI